MEGRHRAALAWLQGASMRVVLEDLGFEDEFGQFLFIIPRPRRLHPVLELEIWEIRSAYLPLGRQSAAAQAHSQPCSKPI